MAKAAAEEEEEQRNGGDTTDTVGRMRERGDSHASWALVGFLWPFSVHVVCGVRAGEFLSSLRCSGGA